MKMTNKIENIQQHNLLLSLSVFKKLYDEKKDIYEIISLFIKRELSKPGLNEFSLTEITQKINEEYNFEIPQAIIKTSLNRIKGGDGLVLKQGRYTKFKNFGNINIFDDDSNSAKKEEIYIITILKEYIEKNTLSDDEIRKSLESYILNRNDTHNIFTKINSCIVKNESNGRFIDGLNEIKYGLILYEGIFYGIERINLNNWNEKTIFLDTEILFHLASYNGKLFKKIANDFMTLINIVNKTKRIVTLKFSEDVKKEVDSLFNVAESVINREKKYRPSEVVKYILDNCQSSSDIVTKKTDFYSFLSKLKIKKYENQLHYDDEKNHQYNLGCEPDSDEKTQRHIKQLNDINMLRKGDKYNALEKVRYLLLTETSNTIHLASLNKDVNDFSLALSLFDLTNQLWIKTNKGLGNSNLPSTFDIRNKAKIALSSSLAKKVSEEFEKVNNDYQDKNIDEDSFIEKISDLKKINSNPDNINESNLEEIKNLIINPDSMERHYGEKALYKQESEKKSHIIKNRDDSLQEKDNEIRKLKTREKEREIRNKRILRGCGCLFIVSLLFYFSDYLMLFIGTFIYIVETLASIYSIFLFVGIVKSWCKKQ